VVNWLGDSARAVGDGDCLTGSSSVSVGANGERGCLWAYSSVDISGYCSVGSYIVVGLGASEKASGINKSDELHIERLGISERK